MVGNMLKRTLFIACLALLGISTWGTLVDAQSVLKVSRGLKSNNISVLIDRAVVLDSNVQFVEVSVANPEIADVQVISNRSIAGPRFLLKPRTARTGAGCQ